MTMLDCLNYITAFFLVLIGISEALMWFDSLSHPTAFHRWDSLVMAVISLLLSYSLVKFYSTGL